MQEVLRVCEFLYGLMTDIKLFGREPVRTFDYDHG